MSKVKISPLNVNYNVRKKDGCFDNIVINGDRCVNS